ncbi:Calcineurin-like phosphoesterase-like protein 6 [Elsinoe fawcettii]|nr:Calcineurin-like phosphoesterase-like protein 6 [Elsinoe fawcettii]
MATIRPAKFLVISDTHNLDPDHPSSPLRNIAPVDVVLHCSDLTQYGGLPSFRKAMRLLRGVPAGLRLVIAGNHDLELDPAYDPDQPDEHKAAVDVLTGPKAEGITYLTEGTYEFTLSSGSKFSIYASPYTPKFCDWAFGYEHHLDRFNAFHDSPAISIATNPIPAGVDIVMTHGPPDGILDLNERDEHCGCKKLAAIKRVKPLMHCFGHIHEGYGTSHSVWHESAAARKNQMHVSRVNSDTDSMSLTKTGGTLFVNAAISSVPLEWPNKPWLVEIEIPRVDALRFLQDTV